MLQKIQNAEEFKSQILNSKEKIALLFHGDFSATSQKVLKKCDEISGQDDYSKKMGCYSVDVGKVKGLHKEYKVSSVPTLVIFKKGVPSEWIQGDQNESFLKNALGGNKKVFKKDDGEGKSKFPPIKVYSTPTCGFCTKLKNYLKEQGVPYRDIDISKDTKAGEELVKKTGQQGVPQTYIGSTHIVGFDKPKIDKLLGLQ